VVLYPIARVGDGFEREVDSAEIKPGENVDLA
jgi:hypothetical protein